MAESEVNYDALVDAPKPKQDAPPEQPSVDYDSLVPDRPATQALKQSIAIAAPKNPDQYAKVVSLANKTGLPADHVERNYDDVKKEHERDSVDYNAIVNDSPITARFASNPDNAAVVKDDLHSLGSIESFVGMMSRAWHSGSLQEELAFARMQQMAGDKSPGLQARIDAIHGESDKLAAEAPKNSLLGRAVYGATEFGPQIFGAVKQGLKYALPAASTGALIGAAAGPAAPIAEAFTVPGMFGAGMVAGGIDYNFHLMSGLAYDQMKSLRDKNGDPLPENIATAAAVATGAVASGLGLVKLDAVMGTIPGGKQFIASFAAKAGAEVFAKKEGFAAAVSTFAKEYAGSVAHGVAAMEGITAANIAGSEGAKIASGQPFDTISAEEVGSQLKQTAEESLLTFGALNLPGSALTLAGKIHQSARETRAAEQQKQAYLTLEQAVRESKTHQRSPETSAEHLDAVTQGTPMAAINLDPVGAETYFQSRNIDTAAALSEVGVSPEEFRTAKEAGTLIRIPIKTWVDKVVGSEHTAGLADHVTFDEGGKTVAQAREQEAALGGAADRVIEDTKIAQDSTDRVAAMRKDVESRISENISGARPEGFTPKEWKSQVAATSRLWASIISVQAEKQGVSADEIMAQMPTKLDVGDGRVVDFTPPTKEPVTDAEKIQQNEDQLFQTSRTTSTGVTLSSVDPNVPTNVEQPDNRPTATVERLKARYGDHISEKKWAALTKKSEKENSPYIPIGTGGKATLKFGENGSRPGVIGFYPNFNVKLTGEIGDPAKFAKGEHLFETAEMLNWLDTKYGATRALIEKYKSEGKSLTITTASDLLAHEDYIAALPKDAKIDIVLPSTNPAESRRIEPGMPSPQRLLMAADKLKQRGFDVSVSTPENGKLKTLDSFTLRKLMDEQSAHYRPGPEGDTVFQADKTKQQGATTFTPDHAIIKLMQADQSTLVHESAHVWLDYLHRQMKSGGEDADWGKVKEWLKIEDIQKKLTRDQHETFARGFEQYLFEGKAPNDYVRSAFRKMSQWLVRIYKNLAGLHEQAGFNINLSDDARKVFDRLLSAEHETDQAEESANVTIGAADTAGLDPSVQKKLESLREKAHGQAFDELVHTQMVEITKEHKSELAATREKREPEVRKEIEAQPIYKAIAEIKDTFGKDAKQVSQDFLMGKLSGDDAAALETFAEYAGFSSADHLANVVIKTESVDHAVKAQLDAEAKPNMKDTQQLRTMAEDAVHNVKRLDVLALEAEIFENKLLKANADAANKALVRNAAKAEEVLKSARDRLEAMPAREAGSFRRYYTAERNAAVKVAKALKDKDFARAADAKRQQMLAHALAIESQKIAKEQAKTLRYLDKFSNIGNDFGNVPYGFARQIDQVLSRFGFNVPRTEDMPSLINIAQGMAAMGEEPYDVTNATGLRQTDVGWSPETLPDFVARLNDSFHAISLPESVMSGASKSYDAVTVSELRDIRDAVKTIEWNGNRNDKFLEAFDRADMREEAKKFRASVEANVGVPQARDLLPGSRHASKAAELIAKVPELYGSFVRSFSLMDTTADTLDGFKEGPAKNNITRPLRDAEGRVALRTAKEIKAADGIFAKHFGKNGLADYKKRNIEIDGRYFTKEEVLCMALNRGNDGNVARLTRGFGWDVAKLDAVLSEHLSKNDFEFCQDTWDHIGKYKADIMKLEMEVNGFVPAMVEPKSFTNQHGTFAGGYYPLAYDYLRSSEAFRNEQAKTGEYKQYSTAKAATEQGHAQARVENVTRPVRLSLGVLADHHKNVIHDIEFRRAIIDVSRFVAMKDVKAALVNSLGVKGYTSVGDWIKAAASRPADSRSFGSSTMRWLRFSAVMSNMGWNFKSIPKIAIENAWNVIDEIGIDGAARSVSKYMLPDILGGYDGGRNMMHQTIMEKSPLMRFRAEHLDRDMAAVMDRYRGEQSGVRPWLHRFAFFTHAFIDGGMSRPLWADTYTRALAAHGDEALAIKQADERVKRTFMSSGIDTSELLRDGSEQRKLWTTAFGYTSMMANRFIRTNAKAALAMREGHGTMGLAIAAKSYVMMFLLPAMTVALTRELMRNDQTNDEDERNKRMTEALIAESTPLKFIPGIRDVVPYVVKKGLGEHAASLQMTPLEGALTTLTDPALDLYKEAFGDGNTKIGEHSLKALSFVAGVPKSFDDIVLNFNDWQQDNGELTWRDFLSRRTKK